MSVKTLKINTGRQPEFDLAKVAAVFFMVIIHVADNMGTVMENGGIAPIVLDFIGGPLAAPVFMFAMGVGMVYTKHGEPKDFAKRGVHLLLLGYVLNFFRETILIIAAHVFSVDTPYDKSLIDTIGTVDILHFAGISFLSVALFRKIGLGSGKILFAALIMQLAGYLANGMFDGTPKTVQYLLGLLFYTNQYVSFPALLWFVYPAAGLVFGEVLQTVTNKDVFYIKVTLTGVITFVVVTIGTIVTNTNLLNYFMGTDYYRQNIFNTMWILSIVFTFMGIYQLISKVLPEKVMTQIKIISTQINTIYIIQWLLITYVIAVKEIIGADYVYDLWIVPTGLLFAVISIALARVYTSVKVRCAKV